MSSKTDLPVDEWFQLGSTEGAQARERYIKDNADYFTVIWRKNYQYKRLEYGSLKEAKQQAQFAANYLQQPVMIYAVINIPGTENGYDTLAETVKPNWSYPRETPPPRQDS